nr:response regulator [Maliibacterium massiliense]
MRTRLMIVDDEYLICELIKNLIHFEALDIELVGQANDAHTALDMIASLAPDIVIMDIRIPELDGLEIVKRICETGMDVKFVMISGHKQWDYAFGAIKYGVEDYLLKPINEQELNHVLERICQRIAYEGEKDRKNELLQLHLADSQKQLRVHFLEDLLREDSPQHDLAPVNEAYRFQFAQGYFVACTLLLDSDEKLDNTDTTRLNNILAKLEKVLLEHVQQQGSVADCECCILGHSLALLINAQDDDIRWLDGVYRKVALAMERYDFFEVTLCVGAVVDSLAGVAHSLAHARAAQCDRQNIGAGRVIYTDVLHFMPPKQVERWMGEQQQNGLKKQIMAACEIASSEKLARCFAGFFAAMDQGALPANAALTALCELIRLFAGAAQECGYNRDVLGLTIKRLYEEIYDQTRIGDIKRLISERACEYLDACHAIMASQKIAPVRIAQEYINEHYSQNISLEDIARQVYLNPAYFSTLFKNETGQNVTDYIIAVRMEMAKQELTRNSLSIDAIAENVGYRDRKHFGQLFKKHVGLTPREYRRLKS